MTTIKEIRKSIFDKIKPHSINDDIFVTVGCNIDNKEAISFSCFIAVNTANIFDRKQTYINDVPSIEELINKAEAWISVVSTVLENKTTDLIIS